MKHATNLSTGSLLDFKILSTGRLIENNNPINRQFKIRIEK